MADEKASPISAAKPPAVNPLGSATAAHASTLKLKPVIRKPVIGSGAPKFAMPSPASPLAAKPAQAPAAEPSAGSLNQLKNVTQKLKDITQQIPQQAILRKTGHIPDQAMTEAQKQASKSRTARISLSDAVGAAPVSNDAAPMKTIRIKRPSDIPAAAPSQGRKLTAKLAASEPETMGDAATMPAAEPPSEEHKETTLTQRKTLKISRPGSGAVRPMKLGLKKPGASEPPPGADAGGPGEPVADIPDVADIPAAPVAAAKPERVREKTSALTVVSFIVQYAACVGMGWLGWLLYSDLSTKWF